MALSGRKEPRQERRGAAAGGQADHGFWLPEGGVVGGDDEVGALGKLGAAAVGSAVHGREDRLSQLADGVEGAVKVLPLPQPVLLGHGLALPQVAADREGSVAGSSEDHDSHFGADGDALDDFGQERAHFGGDGVVYCWAVERDDGDPPVVRGSRRSPAGPARPGRCRAGGSPTRPTGRRWSAV